MKTFTIKVNEITEGYVEVQAETAEEAKTEAKKLYNEGNVVWCETSTEIMGVKAE